MLTIRLSKGDFEKGSSVFLDFDTNIAANKWLPGSIDLFTSDFIKMPPDLPNGKINSVSDTVSLPADAPLGQYTLCVAVGEAALQPISGLSVAVRLGIKGRRDDGWYPLSKIEVVK